MVKPQTAQIMLPALHVTQLTANTTLRNSLCRTQSTTNTALHNRGEKQAIKTQTVQIWLAALHTAQSTSNTTSKMKKISSKRISVYLYFTDLPVVRSILWRVRPGKVQDQSTVYQIISICPIQCDDTEPCVGACLLSMGSPHWNRPQ